MDVAPTAIGDLVRGVTLPKGVRWVGSGGRGQVGGVRWVGSGGRGQVGGVRWEGSGGWDEHQSQC